MTNRKHALRRNPCHAPLPRPQAEDRLRFLSERLGALAQEARETVLATGTWSFHLCGFDEEGNPFPVSVPDDMPDDGHGQALSVAAMLFSAFAVSRYVFVELVEVTDPDSGAEAAWICGRGIDCRAGSVAVDLQVVFGPSGAIADIAGETEPPGIGFGPEYLTLVDGYGRTSLAARRQALKTLRSLGMYETGDRFH